MKRSLATLAVSCAALALPARAQQFGSGARGTTTAGFLELGAAARESALGGAGSATAGDASALYWNPANLGRIPKFSAVFAHAPYIASTFYDYAAFGQNLGALGAWGLGLQYFSAGGIPQTDAAGADVGRFAPYDLAASLGYAYTLPSGPWKGFAAGAAVKLVQSRILKTAQTVALDAGLSTPALLDKRLRLAFTVTNLGGQLRFDQVPENLPFALHVGGSYALDENWLAAMDVSLPRGDRPYAGIGVEYRMLCDKDWSASGRLGVNTQTLGSIDGFSGFTIGLGVLHNHYRFDYAFVPYGGLGQAHRLSIGYEF